mmetsp:Transcript_24922/g.59183  ORF Transcript_24922/g.59183 Transcript_24922/m.59183 type:complete len:88 (-) Transcript_24922:1767-2030(-)
MVLWNPMMRGDDCKSYPVCEIGSKVQVSYGAEHIKADFSSRRRANPAPTRGPSFQLGTMDWRNPMDAPLQQAQLGHQSIMNGFWQRK